jgi:hypothetical protein
MPNLAYLLVIVGARRGTVGPSSGCLLPLPFSICNKTEKKEKEVITALTLFEVRSKSVERCPAHRTHAGPAEEPATRAPLMKPIEIDRGSFVNG